MTIRIILVDDHPLMCHGLRQALEKQPNFIVAGEAFTGAAAIDQAAKLKPDLVVLDMHLPDLGGAEVTRRVLEVAPDTKVVVFSGDAARTMVDAALQAGACGYILKKSVVDELVVAINLVAEGRLYLSPEVGEGILQDYRQALAADSKPPKPSVSERERQLLRLLAEGKRNKEIAVELKLSASSVETYRARLMKKLGFTSSADLIRYAIREGIVSP